MKNRDVYQKDPTTRKLVNEGVATVNDEKTNQALYVLRYELETFVCDGQYEKGMAHILDTYLKNIDQSQQPGVWVSGFYGSGKSHLVKMLRALWLDTAFEDGATARGIANLPQTIRDYFKELNTRAKRYGGLRAASGTLGSGSSASVRLALVGIILKSADLPEQYHLARFVLWLKEQGIYEQVRGFVEQDGISWEEELDNFYVAERLHDALVQAKPTLFSSSASCTETMTNLFPYVPDISSDEMLKIIRQALTKMGSFPLTLVVLDEIQQFIGDNFERADAVREATEACCKGFGGRLIFIGTGQSAISGTANLKHLMGRFAVSVELDDGDVTKVIRQVILAKNPHAKTHIEQMMQTNLGEISRHLTDTTIGHKKEDAPFFSQDYPLLPVRRRFWENTLRSLDQTGTDSQLRNQLTMVHKAIQSNLDEPLGHVVPTDYLYFDSADKLLRSRILPRKVYEKTLTWYQGTDEERLMARACALVFLINKVNHQNKELGIRATMDALADLLVEDLARGSSSLRSKLPNLLDKCDLLIKVKDEYRIQTEESTAWNDDFLHQYSVLSNDTHHIEAERDERIKKKFAEMLRKISLLQGDSKVLRKISPFYGSKPPNTNEIHLWIRDGWGADEKSVQADARQAGHTSPIVFVFLPKRSADDLRHHLIEYKAASTTLEKRSASSHSDPQEITDARSAMQTIQQTADHKIQELLEETFSNAKVFQGGGNEISGKTLEEILREASENALQRLYPHFHIADHSGWAKVYEKAHKGAPDALKAVGDDGEPDKNPVCKALLGAIAGGKTGAEIRASFEAPPFGWSRDAVDGGLQVLLVAGLIRAQEERGQIPDPKDLDRKSIGKATFKTESVTITTRELLHVRKLLQKAGVTVKPGEESACAKIFLQQMLEHAEQAGGEAPKPLKPDTSSLIDLRRTSGNEQLFALYERRDEFTDLLDLWRDLAERIDKRWPHWLILQRLANHASTLPDAAELIAQSHTIQQQRQLLDEPDPVAPLVANLTQLLRQQLNRFDGEYDERYAQGLQRLAGDTHWSQLQPEQQQHLLSAQSLQASARPKVAVQSTEDVLHTLDHCSLSIFSDRIAAISDRFDKVLQHAAKMCEPQTQFVQLPRRTLKSEAEIDAWLDEAKQQLKTALQKGPIAI